MALSIFIDGYNLLAVAEERLAGARSAKREGLLRFLEASGLRGSPRNEMYVVFDGFPPSGWPGWKGETRVVFSYEQDADTVIKERVDALAHPADALVVTNDREIQKWVKGAGARVLSCDDFMRSAVRKSRPGGRAEKPDPETERQINDELERIWKLK